MWIINKNKFKLSNFIFFYIFFLTLPLFSANLNIKDDLITDTLRLIPQNSPPACSSSFKGRLYYNSNDKQIYYCDGTNWQVLGAGGKDTTIGSAIVASSSADTLRADFACDGTDDDVEIQAALNYCNIGGAVYLSEGAYNLSNKITFGNSKSLIGAGASTVLNLTTNNAIQGSGASGIVLSQLRIRNSTRISPCCWFKTKYSLSEKSWLEGCNIYIEDTSFNIIAENIFFCGSVEFLDKWNFPPIYCHYNIVNNNIFAITTGVWSTPSDGSIVASVASRNNMAIGNIMEGNSSFYRGIWIFEGFRSIIVGNKISNVERGISNPDSTHNIFNSNIIYQLRGFTPLGITLVDDAEHLLVSSNFVSDATDGIEISGVDNSLFIGNSLYNNKNGIKVKDCFGNNPENNLISSNYIYASTASGYGISINSTSNNSYLVGNLIEGNGYSGKLINDQGQNTRYTDKIKISLEPGEYTGLENGKTLTPQGPTSYLRLKPSSNISLGNPNIAPGKSKGDILIIENAASGNFYVRFRDGQGVELEDAILVGGKLDLYPGDILVLIWEPGVWTQIGYSDN